MSILGEKEPGGKRLGLKLRLLFEEQRLGWRQLSSEFGAEFVPGKSVTDMTIVARVKHWTVKLHQKDRGSLDDYGSWTLFITNWMTAPYVSRDGFRFRVLRKGRFARLWRKVFGNKDIEIWDSEFERDFIIEGNDESKVRALFANPRIRQLTESQPSVDFGVVLVESRNNSTQGVGILHCDVKWQRTPDVEPFRRLFELFEETLNHLCQIGSASEDKPNLDSVPAPLREHFGL